MRTAFVALFFTLPLACAGDPAPERPSREAAATASSAGDGESTAPSAASRAADWPQWRGPNRDGKSTETGLLSAWPKQGPKLLWSARDVNKGTSVGAGYSSLAIANGRIYTMGEREGPKNPADAKKGKGERAIHLVCLDEATGKEIWATKVGPLFGDGGPRGTPTIDGNRIYCLSPYERNEKQTGFLNCVDATSGKLLWQKDMKQDFGGRMQSGWNYSESPMIDVDKVIVTPGGKNAAMVALNKITGDVIWKGSAPKDCGAGYASIIVVEAGGVKQYITLMGPPLGLVGVDAYTGKFLWNYSKVTNGTAAIPTPLVQGDFVFASSGYGTGAALLKLIGDGNGGVKPQEQYFLPGGKLQNHHGGMILIDGCVYGGHGHNDGQPFCLDIKTGRMKWGPEHGAGSGSAAVVYADGHLYFRWDNNVVGLVDATPDGYHLVSEFQLPKGTSTPGWQHPVIHQGKLYIRGNDQVLCYDIKNK
jgi:outer membrane protein assembly factor BamB